MIKKLFKFIGLLALVLAIGYGVLYYLYNEPLPTGESGPEADALAYRMLDALNYKIIIIPMSWNGLFVVNIIINGIEEKKLSPFHGMISWYI